MKEQKKGISLIVLVITIIVMIILASAVIILLSNSNIITKAKEAVTKTNDKVLAEQADLYGADLILEFRELGYSNLIVPEEAKQTYINALKDGKTEEEAVKLANESFIAKDGLWVPDIYMYRLDAHHSIEYSDLYLEVKRVVDLIYNDEDGEDITYEIDTSIVPEDLSQDIAKFYQINEKYWEDGGGDEAETAFQESYKKDASLLYGFMNKEPDNKYYEKIYANKPSGTMRLPYYFYVGKTIKKMTDYTARDYTTYIKEFSWEDITTLIIDENYKILTTNSVPPVYNAEIILPNTLKKIEKGAFHYARQTTLTIPSSVEVLEENFISARANIKNMLTKLIIKKPEGSIPGAPWGLDTSITQIVWEP